MPLIQIMENEFPASVCIESSAVGSYLLNASRVSLNVSKRDSTTRIAALPDSLSNCSSSVHQFRSSALPNAHRLDSAMKK